MQPVAGVGIRGLAMRPANRLGLCCVLAIVACTDAADDAADAPRQLVCVGAEEAAAIPGAVLLDVRAPSSFTAERPVGAVSLEPAALLREVDGLTNEAVEPTQGAAALAAAGVPRGAPVVVLGDDTGVPPARVAWTLSLFGHREVAVLDGGMQAWRAAALPTDAGPASIATADYVIDRTQDELPVDVDWVLAHLDDPDVVLIDARTPEEFAAGHIPVARSIDWQSTVQDGFFLDDDALAALYRDVSPDATIVTYCQSGMRASVAWVGLSSLGHADVRLYDGSWAQWGSREDLPKETGP